MFHTSGDLLKAAAAGTTTTSSSRGDQIGGQRAFRPFARAAGPNQSERRRVYAPAAAFVGIW
jgi:hypothetical protein